MKKIIGITAGLALILFVVGYYVAVRMIFPPLPEPETGIVVPPLVGLDVRSAEARLRPLGLRVTEVTELAHATQAPGIIIAQSPLPGQQLREMGEVRLAVSAGVPRVRVPNVVGFTAERATATLSGLGFEVNETSEQSARPAGTVTRTSPATGAGVAMPSRIVIFVSSGPPAAAPDTLPEDSISGTRT